MEYQRFLAPALVGIVLSSLGAASPKPAAAFDLFIECRLVGEQTVMVDLAPTASLGERAVPDLDLIVYRVDVEARSESGGFWVQLPQPMTARLEIDLCSALAVGGIHLEDLDAVRVQVIGEVVDGETTTPVGNRCGHFPPPHCPLIE